MAVLSRDPNGQETNMDDIDDDGGLDLPDELTGSELTDLEVDAADLDLDVLEPDEPVGRPQARSSSASKTRAVSVPKPSSAVRAGAKASSRPSAGAARPVAKKAASAKKAAKKAPKPAPKAKKAAKPVSKKKVASRAAKSSKPARPAKKLVGKRPPAKPKRRTKRR